MIVVKVTKDHWFNFSLKDAFLEKPQRMGTGRSGFFYFWPSVDNVTTESSLISISFSSTTTVSTSTKN